MKAKKAGGEEDQKSTWERGREAANREIPYCHTEDFSANSMRYAFQKGYVTGYAAAKRDARRQKRKGPMSKRKHIAFASIALFIAALVPIAGWLVCEGLESLGVVDWAARVSATLLTAFCVLACAFVAGTSLAELID